MPLNQRNEYLLFGREPDLNYLLSLPEHELITAVIARAKMGKTKTLTEVGHRLQEGGCLVGYYEAVGAEHSVLLHALQDAYRSWFSTKSTIDEIVSVFKSSNEPVAKRIFKVAKPMLENLDLLDISGAGKAISNVLGGLLQTNEGLTKGPLKLPTLDYELAHEVASFLHSITDKKIILILDGWEKFKNGFDEELNVLSKIIENENDWPVFHIYLGIRKPEVDDEKNRLNRAPQMYRKLVKKHNGEATSYSLPTMHLDRSAERAKLWNHLVTQIPEVNALQEKEVFEILDGYPSCLDKWLAKGNRKKTITVAGLKQLSEEANNYSYPHLKYLFEDVGNDSDQLDFLVRLALLPQLNDELWSEAKIALLDGMQETILDDLENKNILERQTGHYPSYGHDTQHVAARNYLLKNYSRRCIDNGSKLVKVLAKQITGRNKISISCVSLLLGSADVSLKEVKLDSIANYLLMLVKSLIEKNLNPMYVIDSNSELVEYIPLLSIALFNRGVKKELQGDNLGAIADYTAVIDMSDAPIEQRGLALNNRGVAKGLQGDTTGEIADYIAVINMPDAPAVLRAPALYNRALYKDQQGDTAGAITDYSTVIEMLDAPAEHRAQSLINRGNVRGDQADTAAAIDDYTSVIDMSDAPAKQRTQALYNRGNARRDQGNTTGAIVDYTSVIDMSDAPADQRALALYNRGNARHDQGDAAGAIDDYTAVIDMPDTPADQRAQAFYNRGNARRDQGNTTGAIVDYTSVINMPDAPADQRAQALTNRGANKGLQGDTVGAIVDYTSVINMPDATVDQRTQALINRGIRKGMQGDTAGAIVDFTAVIDMQDASADQRAQALTNRGVAKGEQGVLRVQ